MGGWEVVFGRSPEKILEYRARKVGKWGKWGFGREWGRKKKKKWWKGEDFLGEKFFIPPRSAHYGCDRVLLLTTLYGELVGGL